MAKKTYVLDTNILIQSPNAIHGFDDNDVVVTATTLQELDGLKESPGETGYRAREAIRIISRLSGEGNVLEGVKINEKDKKHGTFRIEPNGLSKQMMPSGYVMTKPDNRIINSTLCLKEKNEKTILITNDISMRVNAEVCGLEVQGYHNEQLETDDYYTGRQDISVTAKVLEKLYKVDNSKEKEFLLKDVFTAKQLTELHFALNEYVVFFNENGERVVGRCIETEPEYKFRLLSKTLNPMSVKARNLGQRMVLDALMAPVDEVPLVILKGRAGTAKTFLSIAAGLDQTLEKKYDKVMITRANVLSDADIGFLPGSLEEKMGPLVAPFMDNMESLFRNTGNDAEEARMQIEDLLAAQTVEICSIAYMRGRSITHSYLIVDEAQNCSINQILEIITRAGEGTKVILCGDPDQIDNPKLDRLNNGLVYAAEKMRNTSLCAQITFTQEETVRSPLASVAAERLKFRK